MDVIASCICGHSEKSHDSEGCMETYGKFNHLNCTCTQFSEWKPAKMDPSRMKPRLVVNGR